MIAGVTIVRSRKLGETLQKLCVETRRPKERCKRKRERAPSVNASLSALRLPDGLFQLTFSRRCLQSRGEEDCPHARPFFECA